MPDLKLLDADEIVKRHGVAALLDTIDDGEVVSDPFDADGAEPDSDVYSHLHTKTNKDGEEHILVSAENLSLILEHDWRWNNGRVRYNDFSDDIEYETAAGWVSWRHPHDDVRLCRWLTKVYGLAYVESRSWVITRLQTHAHEAVYHPVREYLGELPKWDGKPRIDRLLEKYFGADPEQFGIDDKNRAIDLTSVYGRKWMIGAVARIMDPGSKMDTCLIVHGPQGAKKSSTFAALLPTPAWFSDESLAPNSKEAAILLQGTWIHELGELDSMRRAEVSAIKNWMSRTIDKYRAPYERTRSERPRQVVFCGTTNDEAFLTDSTGSRRWWPARAGDCKPQDIARDRNQLWAEALARYKAGEQWWLNDLEEGWRAASAFEFETEDSWTEKIRVYLYQESTTTVYRVATSQSGLAMVPRDVTRTVEMRIARILRAVGWKKRRCRLDRTRRVEWYK